MRIYTKTGDDGTTGLVGGRRAQKTHLRFEAIGDVDELNACLGLCRESGGEGPISSVLPVAQGRLFEMGGELGSPEDGRLAVRTLSDAHVEELERSIDEMTGTLEPLRSFILPGGTFLAARLHLARTVCRRAERKVLALSNAEPVRSVIPKYLNRLSDWLFVAARTANRLESVEDIRWPSEEK